MSIDIGISRVRSAWVVAVLGTLVLAAPRVRATPFTEHFGPLLLELEARSAALTGSLEKAEIKQKKAVDKAIAVILGSSTSLATDLKNAGKIFKSLAKAFPDEVLLAEGLGGLLQGLFDGFEASLGSRRAEAQSTIDELSEGACKEKAEAGLATVDALLAAAAGGDFSTLAKTLGKAVKALDKTGAAAAKCTSAGGSACGDANLLNLVVNGAPWNPPVASVYRGPDIKSLVITGKESGASFRDLSLVCHGVDGPGSYPVNEFSTYVDGSASFFPPEPYTVTGTVTVTGFHYTNDNVMNDCFIGTISVTFSKGGATRTITGSFELSKTIFL